LVDVFWVLFLATFCPVFIISWTWFFGFFAFTVAFFLVDYYLIRAPRSQ
jgi:hypothetical protein